MIKYMNTLSEYVKPRELFSYYRSIQTSVVENIIDLPIGGVALRDVGGFLKTKSHPREEKLKLSIQRMKKTSGLTGQVDYMVVALTVMS